MAMPGLETAVCNAAGPGCAPRTPFARRRMGVGRFPPIDPDFVAKSGPAWCISDRRLFSRAGLDLGALGLGFECFPSFRGRDAVRRPSITASPPGLYRSANSRTAALAWKTEIPFPPLTTVMRNLDGGVDQPGQHRFTILGDLSRPARPPRPIPQRDSVNVPFVQRHRFARGDRRPPSETIALTVGALDFARQLVGPCRPRFPPGLFVQG